MRHPTLPGWDAPTRDWDDRHQADADQGRLVWYVVLALGVLAVAAVMIPNDGAPGVGQRSYLALAAAAAMCWRLTLARNTSLAELLVKVGEWAAVVALLVLLACATGQQSPTAKSAPARPPAAARPAPKPPAKPPAEAARSGLDALTGAVTDAWKRSFGPPPPTRR
jgi:hypothetical protein